MIAGAGPIFSAGADLAWMQRMRDYTRDDNVRDADAAAAMFGALDTLPVPLVGRIQGAALGGGAGLAAVCDVVVAADDAIFGFTEVRLGILPAVIAPFVVAKIGAVRGARAVPDRRPLPRRRRRIGSGWCTRWCRPPSSTPSPTSSSAICCSARRRRSAGPRRCCARSSHRPPADVRPLTSAALADQRVSADGQDGLDAFLHKRAGEVGGRP